MDMRRAISTLAIVTMLGAASTMVSACERKKGPVEKAGEKIDNVVDDVSDAVDPKGPAEKAGRAIDRATDRK